MDRRSLCHHRARSRAEGRRQLGSRRRLRRRRDDAQHPDGENAEGCAAGLRAERRGDPPRTRLSAAPPIPGYEGNTNIKWLRRLEVSDKPFMTREETSKYTDLMANGKARQFTLDMEAKSVITFPSGEMKLPGPGFYNITGLAWSGRGRVQSVDVST